MFALNIHRLNLQKIKIGKAVLNTFIKIVYEFYRKQNKLLVEQR